MTGPWPVQRSGGSDPEAAQHLPADERDYLVWVRGVERRAILPLKWVVLFTAALFWMLTHPAFLPPPVGVFTLFTVYFAFNLGETYFLLFRRVALSQTRIVCLISYAVDILFVTALIYIDARYYPATDGASADFYIFYIVLILRGFALFRTARANLVANAIISGIFIGSLFWQNESILAWTSRGTLIRVGFIWLVILMAWFIVRVISQQKEELIRTREKLVQSENLAMIGQLAAGVAHEINNPIGIISAYADLLKRQAEPEDPRRADYETIQNEAERCETIVKELLNYARPAANIIAATALPDLNDEVLTFVSRRPVDTVAPVMIHKDYQENLPALQLDPSLLKQALLNIYLNAYQALRETPEPRLDISISIDSRASHLVLCLQDNGAGIDSAAMRRIFDPFFTTRAEGTGLGLSITRRIVEACGGELAIRSKKGRGTSVELRFPTEH